MKFLSILIRSIIVAFALVFVTGVGTWAQTRPQLYLVTGLSLSHDDLLKAPSTLYAIDRTKQLVVPVASLVEELQGTDFILADHDRRVIAIGTPNNSRPDRVLIVNMDAPSMIRSVPLIYDGGLMRGYLLDGPNGGSLLGLYTTASGVRTLMGVDLKQETKPYALPEDALGSVRSVGFWSPQDVPTPPQLGSQGGKLRIINPPFPAAELPVRLPESFLPHTDEGLFLAVNNDDVLAIDRYRNDTPVGTGAIQTYSVYDKRSQQWQNVDFLSAGASIRGFGAWLAVAGGERKRPFSTGQNRSFDPRREPVSPGSASRRTLLNPKTRDKEQRTIDDMFLEVPFYFSGDLFLYNVHSHRKYTIQTGQGDSEILLVDGDTVYYRVNDSLFKAQIGQAKIENTQLILTDSNIQFAHWAFMGPSLSQ
jgi:hypothetical protein